MSERTFKQIKLGLTLGIAAVIGVSVTNGNILVPIFVVPAGIIALLLAKQRVQEVIEDERAYLVSEKASRRALSIFGPLVAFLAPVLIIVGQKGEPTLSIIGFTLGIGASLLTFLYWILYGYYSRRYGSETYAE